MRSYRIRVDNMLVDVESDSVFGAFRKARADWPLAVVVSDTYGGRVIYPVGSILMVYPFPLEGVPKEERRQPYRAVVSGTDMGRTKYRVNREMWGNRFSEHHEWAFPAEVVFLGTRGIDGEEGSDESSEG